MTTTLTFLDLTVTHGPNTGMRYSIPQNMFRILSRYEVGFIADERLLNPDQQELVLKYVPKKFQNNKGPDILLDDPVLSTAQGLVLFTEEKSLWVDFMNEKIHNLQIGDSISIGNTKLKVS